MANGFDIAAPSYDSTFTHSQIGKLQRNLVHNYLSKKILVHKNMNILEVNCGTGEDAIWMASLGHQILATDLSEEMISQAKHKASGDEKIIFKHLDMRDLNNISYDKKFDLLFSNFGGLNCLSPTELGQFIQNASVHLNPHGHLVLVVMPKHTLWERLYFLLKGNRKAAFRRNTKGSVPVNLEGEKIDTWYYDPSEIKKSARSIFTIKTTKPIGFFIPPSYLETFFNKKTKLLTLFAWLDQKIGVFSWPSAYSDHYLISLQKQ